MKLRQKLALVLASAMIVTAVPVTTMAASTNTLSHTIALKDGMKVGFETSTVDATTGVDVKLTKYEKSSNHPKLQLKLSGSYDFDTTGYTFYVNLADAEFNKTGFYTQDGTGKTYFVKDGKVVDAAGTVIGDGAIQDTFTVNVATDVVAVVRYVDKDQIEVNVKSTTGTKTLNENNIIQIPLVFTAKTGEPTIEIVAKNSIFSAGKLSLTSEKVGDKALTVKVGDAKNITVDGGELAEITISEVTVNALKNLDAAKRTITLKLKNSSDLEFDGGNVTIKGAYGFNGYKNEEVSTTVTNDGKELKIELPAEVSAKNTLGELKITGVKVSPESRSDAKLGDVQVTVKGDSIAETTAVAATVKDFVAELSVKEVVKPIAGKEAKKVEVTVKEAVKNVLNEKGKIEFNLDKGYIHEVEYVKEDKNYKVKDKDGNVVVCNDTVAIAELMISSEFIELPKNLTIKDVILADGYKGNVVGFEVTTKVGTGDDDYKTTKANEMKVKFNVQAKLGVEGDAKLTVSNRGIEDLTETVATIAAPITAEAKEVATLKVGLKGQTGGSVVIKETKEEMLERGKTLTLSIGDAKEDGIKITGVKFKEDNVKAIKETEDGAITFEIKRSSDEAATIEIEEITFDVNRMTPEGSYSLKVSGDAVTENGGELELKDFVVIGTKNTEDLPSAATKKEIVLAINSKDYTVNGVAKTADAAAFIDENNRTMVPVRFVAEEFGKVDFGTVNGVGTVTVFKDGDVLQFQNGSNIMNKNGIAIPMDTKVVIKDGRTYVPFKYVASGLGIGYDYAADTKTITFKN